MDVGNTAASFDFLWEVLCSIKERGGYSIAEERHALRELRDMWPMIEESRRESVRLHDEAAKALQVSATA